MLSKMIGVNCHTRVNIANGIVLPQMIHVLLLPFCQQLPYCLSHVYYLTSGNILFPIQSHRVRNNYQL